MLASHIIVSGILGSQTQNYFLAAAIGFISHYIMDAIPHWDYYISKEFKTRAETEPGFIKTKFFWKEISKVMADMALGFILISGYFWYSGYQNIAVSAVAIFFGILPDPLQLLYFLTKNPVLKLNFDIQHFLHKEKKPGVAFGLLTQIVVIAAAFAATLVLG